MVSVIFETGNVTVSSSAGELHDDYHDQFMSGAFINKKKERASPRNMWGFLKTKTPSADQLVVNLSGGNQQKVVIAKMAGEKL